MTGGGGGLAADAGDIMSNKDPAPDADAEKEAAAAGGAGDESNKLMMSVAALR